ncbi:MAG: aspartate--tRNA(Asn) ligase [Nanoarchaeota archaeon]|nr:aspartate--tRNA(Asn) ligase [Nanoarchaeota archaeon]
MERIKINELKKKTGKTVLIKGFIHEIRDQSKVKFILLRDNSGIIQTVTTSDKKEIFEKIAKIPKESVISIEGVVKEEKQAPSGIEIHVEKYNILSEAHNDLPISVVEKGEPPALPVRLDWRCLSLRTKKSQAIFKIQSKILEGMQEWLNKNGFQQVFTPCLMGVPSESGSEVFGVNFFKQKAFLRQDPQLHRQLTIAGGIERLYDIGPSWRAEKSHTVRHLTEHRICAVEAAFIEDEKDIMRIEEQVIISAFKKVNEDCKKELDCLGVELKIPKAPFPIVEFPEVYNILRNMGSDIKEGEDLNLEQERLLWKYIQEKYSGEEFYFLNKFPFKKKPFYVRGEDDSDYARSTDLYYKGIEMSSGGQRENRYGVLMKNVQDKKLNSASVKWFTKFFKYGVPTHGGFSIGIERITMVLLQLENIREAVLFPRDTERLTP